jgi:hypothetical protein
VNYVRILQTVAGAVVTWAPALPTAAQVGDTVKGCITYKLTGTDGVPTIALQHHLTNFSREMLGIGIDKLALTFDGTEEAKFTASGPARTQNTPSPAAPGSFTTVGGNPPTGMAGDLYIGDLAYLHTNLGVELTNALAARNVEAGTTLPTEVYRNGRREVALTLEAFTETEATLYDFAEAGTYKSMLRQNGRTQGNIVAVWCPKVDWKVADTSSDDEAAKWSFTGMALESADAANDELTLVLA